MGTIRKSDPKRRGTDEVDRWCTAFQTRCRSRGLRVTAQRLAVYRALAEDRSHPTAESVFAAVQRRMPTLSRATVYRILESLERETLVRRVSSTGTVARFDANVEPHQHVVCRLCARMVDHFAPELDRALLPTAAVPDFEVEELDIRIVGRCAECRNRWVGDSRSVHDPVPSD